MRHSCDIQEVSMETNQNKQPLVTLSLGHASLCLQNSKQHTPSLMFIKNKRDE